MKLKSDFQGLYKIAIQNGFENIFNIHESKYMELSFKPYENFCFSTSMNKISLWQNKSPEFKVLEFNLVNYEFSISDLYIEKMQDENLVFYDFLLSTSNLTSYMKQKGFKPSLYVGNIKSYQDPWNFTTKICIPFTVVGVEL